MNMSATPSVFDKPLDGDINDVAEGLAILVDGDTAPRAITSGQYLFIKNHTTLATGGYHASSAIASGATISSSNVTVDADGIANSLNSSVTALNSKIETQSNILRFQITNGSYASNDNAIITQTYPTSGTPDAYASNNTIKFRRAGNIEIFIHVIGQQDNTSQRLWFELIGSNLVTQHISYGYYCTGDIATIAQVNTSSELSIKFLEAFKVGQGGVGTSYIFVKYM